MDAFADFEKTVDRPVLKQQPASTHKIDFQVLVDEDMRKKWDEAKRGKETTPALIAINEILLHDANTSCTMGGLVQPVEHYARLSLAGSCSAQVRSAVIFLEWMGKDIEGMEGTGGIEGMESWNMGRVKLRESLGRMKRKLELLIKVEDTQKGVSG